MNITFEPWKSKNTLSQIIRELSYVYGSFDRQEGQRHLSSVVGFFFSFPFYVTNAIIADKFVLLFVWGLKHLNSDV